MYKIQKIIKTTVLLAGLFSFVGCGGECCEDDVSEVKSVTPSGTVTTSTDTPTNTVVPATGNIEEKGEVKPIPPIAIVTANGSTELIEVPPCTTVEFSADQSSDPDGPDENLTFSWTSMRACPLDTNSSSFEHKFGTKGLYETTLIVTDEQNLTAIDRICVLVGIEEADMPLIADAGVDVEISADQNVTLSGRAICRDDVANFEWKEGNETISEEAKFTGTLPVGEHTLKLYIEDIAGQKACDSVVVTVK